MAQAKSKARREDERLRTVVCHHTLPFSLMGGTLEKGGLSRAKSAITQTILSITGRNVTIRFNQLVDKTDLLEHKISSYTLFPEGRAGAMTVLRELDWRPLKHPLWAMNKKPIESRMPVYVIEKLNVTRCCFTNKAGAPAVLPTLAGRCNE